MAHLVHRCGFQVGRDLLGPHSCNAKGLWENEGVVSFNEELLSSIGGSWCDPSPIDLGEVLEVGSPERQALGRVLREQYAPDQDIVIKDPRISRLAPLYLRVLQEDIGYRVRIVIVLRSPAASADSLYRRDGIPHRVGSALWVGYMIAALATANADARVIAYDDLLSSDPGMLGSFAAWLSEGQQTSPQIPESLVACVDPSLCHSPAEDGTLEARTATCRLARDVYHRLADAGGTLPDDDEIGTWVQRYAGLAAASGWSGKACRLVLHEPHGGRGTMALAGLLRACGSSLTGLVVIRDGFDDPTLDPSVARAAEAGHLGFFFNLGHRGEAASLVRGLSLCGGRAALLLRHSGLTRLPHWLGWLEGTQRRSDPVVFWSEGRTPGSGDDPEAVFLPGALVRRIDPWPHVAKGSEALLSLVDELRPFCNIRTASLEGGFSQ